MGFESKDYPEKYTGKKSIKLLIESKKSAEDFVKNLQDVIVTDDATKESQGGAI